MLRSGIKILHLQYSFTDALETNAGYNARACGAKGLGKTVADEQERSEPVQSLTREQFRNALRKGLGRAVLHARRHGLAGLEEDVLQACLRTQAYDPQCNAKRAEYLFFLIDLATDRDFFRKPILQALVAAPSEASERNNWNDFWHADQLFDLALIFAKRGDEEARQRMYQRFDQQVAEDHWLGEEQIIELDGIDGLVHMASVIGDGWKRGVRRLDEAFLLRGLAEHYGKEVVLSALIGAAETDPNVKAFLETAESGWLDFGDPQTASVRVPPAFTLKSILARVETAATEYSGQYFHFGRIASEEDLELVFNRLLQETRPEQLMRYLWIFGRRSMPRLERRILELAETPSQIIQPRPQGKPGPHLQIAAIMALAHLQDPAIRDLGIRLLLEQPHMVQWGVIDLFKKNYQAGDIKPIMTVLPTEEVEAIHWAGHELTDLAEAQDLPELTGAMLWVYDRTPCSTCRQAAFTALVRWNRAPAEMLAEARWDCDAQTRQLALQGCEDGEDRCDATRS